MRRLFCSWAAGSTGLWLHGGDIRFVKEPGCFLLKLPSIGLKAGVVYDLGILWLINPLFWPEVASGAIVLFVVLWQSIWSKEV